MNSDVETNGPETPEDPDNTNEIGRQINCYRWAEFGGTRMGDIGRGGHHQPRLETNEQLDGRTNFGDIGRLTLGDK